MDSKERIRNVKKAKSESFERAREMGARDAKRDFPEILKAIETSATSGSCLWTLKNPFPGGAAHSPPCLPYYDGYKGCVAELIEDGDFSFDLRSVDTNSAFLFIRW